MPTSYIVRASELQAQDAFKQLHRRGELMIVVTAQLKSDGVQVDAVFASRRDEHYALILDPDTEVQVWPRR